MFTLVVFISRSEMEQYLHCFRPFISTRCNDIEAGSLLYEIQLRVMQPLMHDFIDCSVYKDQIATHKETQTDGDGEHNNVIHHVSHF